MHAFRDGGSKALWNIYLSSLHNVIFGDCTLWGVERMHFLIGAYGEEKEELNVKEAFAL
jgi:hypothetical protein